MVMAALIPEIFQETEYSVSQNCPDRDSHLLELIRLSSTVSLKPMKSVVDEITGKRLLEHE
jgi:hypothetical protein